MSPPKLSDSALVALGETEHGNNNVWRLWRVISSMRQHIVRLDYQLDIWILDCSCLPTSDTKLEQELCHVANNQPT